MLIQQEPNVLADCQAVKQRAALEHKSKLQPPANEQNIF